MELFLDLNITERIVWGLLSFIFLIVYLRWVGVREDYKKDEPPEEPKRQAEDD